MKQQSIREQACDIQLTLVLRISACRALYMDNQRRYWVKNAKGIHIAVPGERLT